MLAVGALGGYAMPVYPDATPDEIRHFTQEAQARYAIAEDQEQVDKVLDLREHGAAIEHIVYDDPRGLASYPQPGLLAWDKLVARGAERLAAEPGLRDALIGRAQPDDPAVLRPFVGHDRQAEGRRAVATAICWPACATRTGPARSASTRRSSRTCRWPGSATSR